MGHDDVGDRLAQGHDDAVGPAGATGRRLERPCRGASSRGRSNPSAEVAPTSVLDGEARYREWITEGEPEIDVNPYRAWRFGEAYRDRSFASACAREAYR
jgi:hypothetical protein